jgi:predicted N-acetyltransferase YhbS
MAPAFRIASGEGGSERVETAVDRTIAGAGAHGAHLAPIEVAEPQAVEHLLDLAFGPDRHRRTAYRLREGVAAEPVASCAAFDEAGRLVGSLQSWPLALTGPDGMATPLWLVGPIAVHPDRQKEGIGRAMLRRALTAIDGTGIPAVLIGDPGYYGPFGFDAGATGRWALPGPFEPHRLLARLDEGEALPAEGMLGPRA